MFHFLIYLTDQHLALDVPFQIMGTFQLTGTFVSLQGFSQQSLGRSRSTDWLVPAQP